MVAERVHRQRKLLQNLATRQQTSAAEETGTHPVSGDAQSRLQLARPHLSATIARFTPDSNATMTRNLALHGSLHAHLVSVAFKGDKAILQRGHTSALQFILVAWKLLSLWRRKCKEPGNQKASSPAPQPCLALLLLVVRIKVPPPPPLRS